ncbi:MAG TPA: tRNA pseudouridine(55) synthase TruB [Candidatus Hydrogenedens sp.]|nr:tRNA pseudouridine(55) synthase TruB [Candidatus Hydrogenedens sp.]HPP57852.1 tRNA pseudouridine(55) synthase TruB [Candidatus Hydrogenedens sp.]
MDGILLVDKPSGITSHDVVDYIRKKTGIKKVGHTGTLDPNATGLLILSIGKATRLTEYFVSLDKTYEGKLRLGIVSDTHDIDGNIIQENPVPKITKKEIDKIKTEFLGEIEQIPPMFSAIKIGGQRLYKVARKGITIERKPRKVNVYEFSILKVKLPDVWIRISCSRGTYVRTLCHDLGEKIGCGAVLIELRRLKVGKYSVDNAIPMENIVSKETLSEYLIPIEKALDLPVAVISKQGECEFSKGNKILNDNIIKVENGTIDWLQVFNNTGKFLGIGIKKHTAIGPYIIPKKVFIT